MIDPEENVLRYKNLQELIKDVCKKYKTDQNHWNTVSLIREIKLKNPSSIFHLIKADVKERDSQYLFRLKTAVIKEREHKKRLSVFESLGS
jgi:hypothetical protein